MHSVMTDLQLNREYKTISINEILVSITLIVMFMTLARRPCCNNLGISAFFV